LKGVSKHNLNFREEYGDENGDLFESASDFHDANDPFDSFHYKEEIEQTREIGI